MSTNNHCLFSYVTLLHLIFIATLWVDVAGATFNLPVLDTVTEALGEAVIAQGLPWGPRSAQAQTQASLPHIPLFYHQTIVPLKSFETLTSNLCCDRLRGKGCGQSESKGGEVWRINKTRQWRRGRG